MIKLNLLPASERKHFQILKIEKCILCSFLILFLYFCLAGGALFFFQYQLQQNLLILKEDIKQEEQSLGSNGGVKERIKEVNSSLKSFDTLQKKRVFITPLMVEIFSLTPPEINYKKVAFDKTEPKIILSGIAEERDKLLEFQDDLEGLEGIKKINSPLSNLEREKQGEFLIELFLEL